VAPEAFALLHETRLKCSHTAPGIFRPGQDLTLSLTIADQGGQPLSAVRLLYRHVNQAERWRSVDANAQNGAYSAVIPAEYTASEYPLEYYFELKNNAGNAWMFPGFKKTLSNQPYFAVAKRSS
jgi:hypothetical protein